MTTLVTTAYAARKRLVASGRKDWSLAILVPTKKMTRLVSNVLRTPPAGMTEIPHVAAIELEAPILSAEIIAFLMQPDTVWAAFRPVRRLDVQLHFRARAGTRPHRATFKWPENSSEHTMRSLPGKRPRRRSGGTAS